MKGMEEEGRVRSMKGTREKDKEEAWVKGRKEEVQVRRGKRGLRDKEEAWVKGRKQVVRVRNRK